MRARNDSSRPPGDLRETGAVRIGTWNLEGRWDERHLELITRMACDLLLLTEVPERVELPETNLHIGAGLMAPRRRWAAIATCWPLRALDDPHGASAMAEIAGLRVCSSILPWRGSGDRDPWRGGDTAERTEAAVSSIELGGPAVWGGDWNHALLGREWSGSQRGRQAIAGAVDRLGLQVPTNRAPHRIDGLLSIDHIAVPSDWKVLEVLRHSASVDGVRISDHDAYVVEVDRGT